MKRLCVVLLLFTVAVPPAAAVIDPFYRNRMESGVRAFEQGNWEAAAHQLRIACFGHLDEPVALVGGLVRLAVAESRRGDEETFLRIFSRLVEVEEKFSAYSRARLPQELRHQFEGLAAQLVPADELRAAHGFASVAQRAEVAHLSALPPEERRSQLETRLQAEPDRAEWPLELARLELAVRRPAAALDWLDRLPAGAAGRPPATCLRQQAASEAGDCSRMDLSGAFCREVPAGVVEFRLDCLVEAARWADAAALIGGLAPELRQRRRIVRQERRVSASLGEEEFASAVAAARASESPPDVAPVAVDTPVAVVTPERAQELEALRRRLVEAATAAELTSLATDVEQFVVRSPDSRAARLLAAEIAYLRSDWPAAVSHFDAAGTLRADEAQLAFYRAVALYESGDSEAAAAVLRPVAWRLERSSFVDAYVDRILTPGI